MKLYEQLVSTYLTQIEGCAIMPQLQIHRLATGDAASAKVDFLALDFATKELQVIEVSNSRKLDKATQLGKSLAGSHREQVESSLREGALHGQLTDWTFRWRLFVRAGLADVLRSEDFFSAHGDAVEIVTLEHVFNTLRDRLDRLP